MKILFAWLLLTHFLCGVMALGLHYLINDEHNAHITEAERTEAYEEGIHMGHCIARSGPISIEAMDKCREMVK